jgi:hypothetical protein
VLVEMYVETPTIWSKLLREYAVEVAEPPRVPRSCMTVPITSMACEVRELVELLPAT